MTKRTEWMEGVLWAEEYIKQGNFFADDPTGIATLNWELFHSGGYFDVDSQWFKGACDYLDYLRSGVDG